MVDGTWSPVATGDYGIQTYTIYEDSTQPAQLLIEWRLTRAGVIGG